MKYFGIILLILVAFTSCDSSKAVVKEGDVAAVSNDTIQIANVGLEYEIVFIEPGFESWLVTQKPEGYYGQSFLEGRNRLFVTEFNRRVQNFQLYDRNLYELEINYDFNLDYGYEVNYMLYNYFLYFQERYNQSFIGGRRNTQWRN
jgi:Family of unknown function (DUF6146)